MFFKSAHDIRGVSDNLFAEGFLRARRVTNLFLVSSLELESKFKAVVKAWCSAQTLCAWRPGFARWKRMS